MITIMQRRETATHARLSWREHSLRIEWGYFKYLEFRVVTVEVLLFTEYPELQALHDGHGWNAQELQRLMDNADGTALPEAVTVLLTQKDINLLSEVGLAVQ